MNIIQVGQQYSIKINRRGSNSSSKIQITIYTSFNLMYNINIIKVKEIGGKSNVN